MDNNTPVNNTPVNNQNIAVNTESDLNIRDIIEMCLSKWYWFAISLVVILGCAVFYILRTPSVYSRTATLLIKEMSTKNNAGGDLESLLGAGVTGQSTSRLANEIIAFKSPALMQDVVDRLGLQNEYRSFGRFHDNVIYGSQIPVNVDFIDIPGDYSAYMELAPDGNNVKISKAKYFSKGDKFKMEDLTVAYGDTVNTEIGRIVVSKSSSFVSEEGWTKPIAVSHSTVQGATRKFSNNLSVARSGDSKNLSDVLDISMNDVSISRANDVINMLITIYNENWVEDKNRTTVSTSIFIKDRLEAIEKDLGSVDADISSFKSKNLIPDVAAVADKYMTQSAEIASAIQDLDNEAAAYRYLQNFLTTSSNNEQFLPSTGKDNAIANQIAQYNSLVKERNDIVASSSVKNPLAKEFATSIEMTRQAIVSSVDNQLNTIQAQKDYFKTLERSNRAEIANSPNQAQYLGSVERQQKVKEELYIFLLQKREENELSQAFSAYNTRLITPPTGTPEPILPNKKQILMIAFLLGLCLPLGVIYLLEVTDNKVRGRKDIENLTIPFIGEIPLKGEPIKRHLLKELLHMDQDNMTREEGKVVVKPGKRDAINEAFRVVRTNLEFMNKESKNPIIMVTSFNPGSGKTFVSYNLALAIAIKGKKVLVIDGDLRRGSSSQYVKSPSMGFSNYLAGQTNDLKSLLVVSEECKDLVVLPCGTIPPNPSELIGSEKFVNAVESLKPDYDYVFIDCPPIDIVADAQIVNDIVDKSVFIVRSGLLNRNMLPQLQKIYNDKRFNNMSMILNGTQTGSSHYGYRSSYNYGYYGYGYGSKNSYYAENSK